MAEHSAEWQIGTVDLRRGLAAVTPHINPDQDQATTHRVRIEISAELLLMATDGYTAGIYACDAQHVRTFGLDYVDLSPADVAKILAVFKAGKDEDADYPESVLEFTVTEKLVTIRDVSGMFAGHELELPATPPADFPNVARILADRLTTRGMLTNDGAGEIVQVGHKMMGRFTASGKAMAGPLAIDTESTPFVVTCGDEFIGMIMPIRWGDGERDNARDRQGRWSRTADRLANAVSRRQAGGAVPELLIDAIRSVGNRQVATVVSLAESLSVDKATATDLLDQMYRAGLIGPPKRGKSREVMFSPDDVDRALAKLAGDVPERGPDEAWADAHPGTTPAVGDVVAMPPDPSDAFPGEGRMIRDAHEQGRRPDPGEVMDAVMDEFAAIDGHAQPPESPFSDPPGPPEPWTDSDGNPWPTSPFDA